METNIIQAARYMHVRVHVLQITIGRNLFSNSTGKACVLYFMPVCTPDFVMHHLIATLKVLNECMK